MPIGSARAAAMFVAVLCLSLLSAGSASAAYEVRDPDLPNTPRDLGDMYLVDDRGERWCPYDRGIDPPGVPSDYCPPHNDSIDAFWLTFGENAWGGGQYARLLRVGKANDHCTNREPPHPEGECKTAVPPVPADTSCSTGQAFESTWCQLAALKSFGISPGVIISAGGNDEPTIEKARDVLWQACKVHQVDRDSYPRGTSFPGGPGFYDFLFLDFAGKLSEELKPTVAKLERGQLYNGESCGGKGWDVITNDNGWENDPNHSLATEAYGHAQRLHVFHDTENETWQHKFNQATSKDAQGDWRGPALQWQDRRFIEEVHRKNPDGGEPVLRAEVAVGTSRLSQQPVPRQITLYERIAAQQNTPLTPNDDFSLLFPFYNHGNPDAVHPYDAWYLGTASRWYTLMRAN